MGTGFLLLSGDRLKIRRLLSGAPDFSWSAIRLGFESDDLRGPGIQNAPRLETSTTTMTVSISNVWICLG